MQNCIEWQGYRDKDGYGKYRPSGENQQSVHRLAWQARRGEIPKGMCVLHQCDNPPCLNVQHLFLGTHKDNSQDMSRKGRAAGQGKTHCVNGHPLTEDNLVKHMPRRRCLICHTVSHRAAVIRYDRRQREKSDRNRTSG